MPLVRFRIRRDTATDWASVNPVLKLGEPALESDTAKVKYGDGATPWNTLPYAAGSLSQAQIEEIARDAIGAALVEGANIDITVNDAGDTITIAVTGAALNANNLSDLASAITARANLDVDKTFAHIGHITGRWYSAHPGATLANGGTLNSTRSYWTPFFIPEAVTVSDLAARVITASAGGLFGLAIYANDPTTNLPTGTALASLTGLSTTTGNTPVSGTLGSPVMLARGWYWSVHMVDNATATFTILAAASAGFPGLIGDGTLSNVALAAASQITGYQINSGFNYSTGFIDVTGATFNVASAVHAALYYKA